MQEKNKKEKNVAAKQKEQVSPVLPPISPSNLSKNPAKTWLKGKNSVLNEQNDARKKNISFFC